ncbi:MAG TPA: ATP-binding protein [Myxococcales bacterium]|jgi:PAS domain S-box-containing protein
MSPQPEASPGAPPAPERPAEEAPADSAPTLRAILDATQESVWLFGADGTIRLANRSALGRLGLPLEEVVGRNLADLLPAEFVSPRRERLRRVVESGRPLQFEERCGGVDYLHRLYPVAGPDGRAGLVADFCKDVTWRRRAEAAQRVADERLRIAQDAARLGIHDYDVTSGDVECDGRLRELWGLEPGEAFTYQKFMAGLHPDDRAATQAAVDAALDPVRGGTYRAEYRVVGRRDGVERWVAATGKVFYEDGRAVRLAGTVEDVTERKRTEEALRRANERLEEADRAKNEFLATLSHELRNPLTPIRNGISVLERAAPGSEEARRATRVLGRQTAQLARLVDDLLDLTRVLTNRIRLQRRPLDLVALVGRTLEDYASHFQSQGLELRAELCGEAAVVEGDEARLAQGVGNLLQNGAKFTPSGGHVAVRVRRDPLRRLAVLEVSDDGLGIPPHLLRRIFQPFVQAEATLDRSKGGLGVGLALVKAIVELHDGQVSAHSEGVGRGCRFVVQLPLAEADAAPAEEPGRQEGRAHPGPRRILVIEDSRDAAETLRDALGLGGHRVEIALDGMDGLSKARQFKPEIVLCDIGLPRMDGYEVARAFRADPSLGGCVLVAMTGYARPEDLQRAAAAGFHRHLAKPPDLHGLERLMAELLGPGPAPSREPGSA